MDYTRALVMVKFDYTEESIYGGKLLGRGAEGTLHGGFSIIARHIASTKERDKFLV